MNDAEFNALADATLARLEAALEAAVDAGADFDFELAPGGILEVEFDDGSKIVVNRHAANQELWIAAKSGGYHFARSGEQWIAARDGAEFFSTLSAAIRDASGEDFQLEA